MEFRPENTAISRKKISSPLEYLLERKYFLSKKHHKVFDYGCGRGKDFRWLKENGYKVSAWDPHWKPDNKPGPEEKFDVVLCAYVLNVISTPKKRRELINDIWNYVAPGGFLLLSTPTVVEISKCSGDNNWTPCGDGYVSSNDRKTFQKGFSGDELRGLLYSTVDDVGFIETSRKSDDFSYILAARAYKEETEDDSKQRF